MLRNQAGGYLEFLAEEIFLWREFSVHSFEFLFLLGKLEMSVWVV